MRTALVTGAPEWVSPIAIALKSESFEILSAADDVPPSPNSVDCYVQLPGDVPHHDQPGLEDVRGVVTQELLARVDLMTRLAPALSASATVLVVGSEPFRPMLEMLATAIATERAGVNSRVVTGSRPDEIAALAGRSGHPGSWRSYLQVDPEAGFADWRDAVLCLASGEAGG